ncbi:MAG: DUF2070 family protein [Methanosarcinales archaeon]|nr:DUF2070 family protein [Methanosarcinales archaeon]
MHIWCNYLVFFNTHIIFHVYITALGAIFVIRMIAIFITSKSNILKVVAPASLQTVFGGIGILFFNPQMEYFIFLIIGCAIFVFASDIFFRHTNIPMKKLFGVNTLTFIKSYLSHVKDGSNDMEELFKNIGEYVTVPITVLNFKDMNGKNKATIIIPAIHPGPIGEIGSGNLPDKIAEKFDGIVFVPHGTTTHDFNLTAASEIDKIIFAATVALDQMEYTTYATKSIRLKINNTSVIGQRFGKFERSIMMTVTHSPMPADDIDFSIGVLASANACNNGMQNAVLIDAHNCTDGSPKIITPGSKVAYDIIEITTLLAKSLFDIKEDEIKIGVAALPPMYSRHEGMGPLGIRAIVMEVSNQKTAFVLIDGNNMIMGLREKIIDKLLVNEAEIMTTDTHVVNVKNSKNYIGMRIDSDELISIIQSVVNDAINDLEPTEVGVATTFAKDVSIFGSYKTSEITSTLGTILSMSRMLILLIIMLSITLLVIMFDWIV